MPTPSRFTLVREPQVDLDLWVRPTVENANRVWRALQAFGAPLDLLALDDLTSDDLVFQIGVAPNGIDILTNIGSTDFEVAWKNRVTVAFEGIPVSVIAREELIEPKREAGRPRDLADVAELQGGE